MLAKPVPLLLFRFIGSLRFGGGPNHLYEPICHLACSVERRNVYRSIVNWYQTAFPFLILEYTKAEY